jgi:hypothetical protein
MSQSGNAPLKTCPMLRRRQSMQPKQPKDLPKQIWPPVAYRHAPSHGILMVVGLPPTRSGRISVQWNEALVAATSMIRDIAPESTPTSEVAKQRILHQPHLTMQRIWCEFQEGRLFLRGQVPSYYFKQLAQEAVADMDGVRQVVNEIEVVW